MPEQREIPQGYEKIEHHDHLDLHNYVKGIVITIHDIDFGKWDYKVIGAQNQETFYEGAFQSLSHAEDKALELAREH